MAITRVVMPKLSDAMETGKLLKWLKKEGDRVEGGEILAEIETDKADIELEAFGSGVLRKILVSPGTDVPVGAAIAVIADPTEDISSAIGPAAPEPAAKPELKREAGASTREAKPAPPAVPKPQAPVTPPASPPQRTTAEPEAEEEEVVEPSAGRVRASPLARRLARESGVALTLITGSGPGGRIVRRDIEAALARKEPTPPVAEPAAVRPVAPVAPGPEVEERPLSSMRKTIAKRMAESKATIPHFYLTVEVKMDHAWELREQLNRLEGQPKVSVTDLILKASALALQAHPEINASFAGESIRIHRRVHLGIAVALDDGLITPVLRECDAKSLTEIAGEARDLTERARNRKLKTQEITGATFTVSNLGMYDIEEFGAIINPPEGAILAVGSVVEKPVIEGGQIRIGRRMRLTLSCDHRVMDGAMGARFLQTITRLLEEPLRLILSS